MRWERGRVYLWILAVASGLLFCACADMPLTDGDSALYGSIARNVLSSGDWVVMGTRGWLLDKPPLTIWLTAIGIKLFGATPLALRWWHSLMAVSLILTTYAVCRLFYEPATSFLAGAVTGTSILVWYSGIVPQQDIPAALFTSVTLYGLIGYLERQSSAAYYVMWVGAGLAALNRAFAGLVLPAGVAFVYLGLRFLRGKRRPAAHGLTRGAARIHLLAGPLLFAAIAFPWFVLGYLRMGYEFIDYHLFSGSARFFANPRGASGPAHFWSYAPLLVASFLPWSGLMFQALRQALPSLSHVIMGRAAGGPANGSSSPQRSRGEARDAHERMGDAFFLTWFAAAFALPFPLKWRVIRYLLPSIPPLAALTARFIAPVFAGGPARLHSGRLKVAAALSCVVVVPLVVMLVLIVAGRFPEEQARYLRIVSVPLGGLGVTLGAFVVLSFLGRGKPALSLLLGLTALTYLATSWTLACRWETVAPWQTMSSIVDMAATPASPILAIEVPGDELVFLDFYVSGPIEAGDVPACARRMANERRTVVAIVGNSAAQSVRESSLSAGAFPEVLFQAPSGTQVLRLSFDQPDRPLSPRNQP